MKQRLGLVALVPLLLVAAVACKKNDTPVVLREITDDDLHAMVLKVDDLPPGFAMAEEKLTNNEEFAKNFEDAEKVRGMIDTWGRAAGLENVFSAAEAPDKPRQPLLVSSSVDRYSDLIKVREAWAGQGELSRLLKVLPSAPKKIDGPRVGEQAMAERMYLTDKDGRELVVYAVSFRRGTVISTVATYALKNKDDRGDHAFQLARLVDERVSARLK
jgi:hypothetical protein